MTPEERPKFFEINTKTDINYAFKNLQNIETNIIICGSGSQIKPALINTNTKEILFTQN